MGLQQLFGPHEAEPHDLDWLYSQASNVGFHVEADLEGHVFVENVWRLLKESKHWKSIQQSPVEACLWAAAVIQSFNDYVSLVFMPSRATYVTARELLRDVFDDEAELVRALSIHLMGYDQDNAESFGLPDSEDDSLFSPGAWDLLIDADARVRAQFRSLIRTRIGSPELVINFYRDPIAWGKRLGGEAMPEQRATPMPDWVDTERLVGFAEELFWS